MARAFLFFIKKGSTYKIEPLQLAKEIYTHITCGTRIRVAVIVFLLTVPLTTVRCTKTTSHRIRSGFAPTPTVLHENVPLDHEADSSHFLKPGREGERRQATAFVYAAVPCAFAPYPLPPRCMHALMHAQRPAGRLPPWTPFC